MRLIEGDVVDERDTRITELEQEVEDYRAEVTQLKFQLADAQRQGTRGLTNLRRQLSPLYKALQDVFGELDKAGVQDGQVDTGTSSRVSAVWESWKSKLPGNTAKVIDALLLHGEMNSTQIGIAIGIHRNNVPQLIWKLNKAGLITKNGTKYSLKQL